MKTLITICPRDFNENIFDHETVEYLKSLSEVHWLEENNFSENELSQVIGDYDIVISGWPSPKLTAKVLDHAQKLRFVGHAAGTVVPFVDQSIFERGIKIVNANNALARSTAEFTLALILNGTWEIAQWCDRLKNGDWLNNETDTVPGLQNQTIGIIGLGRISRYLMQLLRPFNPEILLFSNYCTQAMAQELDVQLCSLDELLQRSQIISLNNTLTPRTKGMLGAKELSLIQDNALLVNAARGPIIDEQALIDTLQTGRIFAAIDVFHDEPVKKDYPLLQLKNVICAPHMGGFSQYWRKQLGRSVVDNIQRWMQGETLEGEITLEEFLRQSPK